MTISRVNHSLPTPVVEDKANDTAAKRHDPHRSRPPVPPATQKQDVSDHLPDQKAARANMLANSERENNAPSSTRKTSGTRHKESATKSWNNGFTTACELVQTLTQLGTSASASLSLQDFEKMIRPLTTAVQTLSVPTLLNKVIGRLWTTESPIQDNEDTAASAQPNTDLLKKLEDLKADDAGFNALGFHAVMTVMSAAAGIADSIREGITENKVNEACARVNKQVLDFAHSIASRLRNAFPAHADSTQKKHLVAMAKASIGRVAFQYLPGKGMNASLSHSMMTWSRIAHGKERQALQQKLEDALGCFLDAHFNQSK